jgi:imidazolonepropionase-like amidohydrolase
VSCGELAGPRILACGKPITTTGGHIYSDWGVDTADGARTAVRLLASRGVDFVKLVVSGGTTTPGTTISRAQYGIGEVRAVVEDAHRLGLPVAGHCISTDSIGIAAGAGIDTIEHCSWIGEDPAATVTDPLAVEAMVRNDSRVDHAIIPRPYLFPEEGGGEPTVEESWWLAMLRVRWPFLRTMREAGVTVFLGTDACFGAWPGTALWPGFQDMARALEILVRHGGFAPLDAIGLATGEAARALGLGSEIGTVAPGKRADLLLLRGDPLSDMRALRSIFRVYRDGQLTAEEGSLVLPGGRAG